MNGSTIATLCSRGELGDGACACAERVGGRRVVEVDAQQHLAPVEARGGDRCSAVAGEAVVVLKGCVGQATPVHRAENDLVVERPEQQEVLDHIGRPEDSVDPGHGQCCREPVEQVVAVTHRPRDIAHFDHATGGMVSGD